MEKEHREEIVECYFQRFFRQLQQEPRERTEEEVETLYWRAQQLAELATK